MRKSSIRPRVALVAAAILSMLSAPAPLNGAVGAQASATSVAPPGGSAPGGPGSQSYLDGSRKDCFGTRRQQKGPYFIRLSPTGDPKTRETYDLGHGRLSGVDQSSVTDAGFFELTRLGELPANDPDVLRSLEVVDTVLRSKTRSGPGWHRYGVADEGSTDGYGDCYEPGPTGCSPNGAPWYGDFVGSGHIWPLLSGERAEQDLQTGHMPTAVSLPESVQAMSSGRGLVPEQVWEGPDVPSSPYGANPTTASIGFTNGQPAGSAAPLIWAQAQYLRLVQDLGARALLDQPEITAERYVTPGPPTAVDVSITSPPPGAVASGDDISVTGTASPSAMVVISASQPMSPTNTTSIATTAANSDGDSQASVPVQPGQTVITVTATHAQGATGWAHETVTEAYSSLSADYDKSLSADYHKSLSADYANVGPALGAGLPA